MSAFNKSRDLVWQNLVDSVPVDKDPPEYQEIVQILEQTPLTYRPALLAEMIRIAVPAFRFPEGMESFIAKAIAKTAEGMRIVGPVEQKGDANG